MFFDIGDTGLAQRLAEAINAAIVGPIELPLEAACPQEEAAYQAAAMHYFADWGISPVSQILIDVLGVVVIGGLVALIYIAVLSSLPGRLL